MWADSKITAASRKVPSWRPLEKMLQMASSCRSGARPWASLIEHGEPRQTAVPSRRRSPRDFDASQLRSLAKKTKDGPQARRLLALAAIYDGATRTEAAMIGGVGLQII